MRGREGGFSWRGKKKQRPACLALLLQKRGHGAALVNGVDAGIHGSPFPLPDIVIKKIIRYRKPLNLNIGMLIFAAIFAVAMALEKLWLKTERQSSARRVAYIGIFAAIGAILVY